MLGATSKKAGHARNAQKDCSLKKYVKHISKILYYVSTELNIIETRS